MSVSSEIPRLLSRTHTFAKTGGLDADTLSLVWGLSCNVGGGESDQCGVLKVHVGLSVLCERSVGVSMDVLSRDVGMSLVVF